MWADTTTIPSGSWTDPGSWVALAREIGVGGLFGVVILLLVAFLTYKAIGWTIGPNGWVTQNAKEGNDARLKLLDTMDTSLKRLTGCVEETRIAAKDAALVAKTATDTQLGYCHVVHGEGGPANVCDLREAGHAFAEMGRKIGEKVGAEVTPQADEIHKVLRQVKA